MFSKTSKLDGKRSKQEILEISHTTEVSIIGN